MANVMYSGPFLVGGPLPSDYISNIRMVVTNFRLSLHAFILEFVYRDVLLVSLEHYGFRADVELTFLFNVLLLGYGIHVTAEACKVADVCLVFLEVVEGKAPRLGRRNPHVFNNIRIIKRLMDGRDAKSEVYRLPL